MVVRPLRTSTSSGSYAFHAFGNHDGRHAGAVIECTIADVYHAIGNNDRSQFGAALESIIPYAGHTILYD